MNVKIAVLVTLVLLLAPPGGSASAGTYDVYACDANVGANASPSWAGQQDPGLTAYNNCASVDREGLVARTDGTGTNGLFQGAYAIFDAPAGSTVDSLHADIQLSRPNCDWGVGVVASNGDLAGNAVYYLYAGQCGIYGVTWLHQDLAIHASRVRLEARCGNSSCSRTAGNPAKAQMRNIRVTVNDPNPPSLNNPRGSLWSSDGWLAGVQSVAFDASDAGGISRADVLVDGQKINGVDNACDFTQRSPCPNTGLSKSINTAAIKPDGPHFVALEVVDAAGNATSISKQVRIDNTAPAGAQGLSVSNGEGWRSANNFAFSWTNPPPDGGAPIAGAEYHLCPSSLDPCISGTRAGDGISGIDGLQVPSPGDWTLRLWVRDAAGNEDPATATPPVHLRFDDRAPELAFEAPDPSDPTLVLVRAADSPSGIADAHVQIRREGTTTWETLPSTFDGTHISARLDDEHLRAGNYQLQAWAVDAAGNERTTSDRAGGGAAQVRLPVRVQTHLRAGAATLHHHRRPRYRTTVRVHFGRRQRLAGQLLSGDANPIAGSPVLVYSQERRPGAPLVLVASLTTTSRGRFAYRAPAGPSRLIRFRFGGTSTIRPSVRDVSLIVPGRTMMRVDRTHFVNGEYVHLRGRLLGGEIPSPGKLVELQVLLRGSWHTFATVTSDTSGAWRFEYRFDGTRGHQSYRMRAALPPEAGWPYAAGVSRSVRLHVRGL